jgi:hypothetical protein
MAQALCVPRRHFADAGFSDRTTPKNFSHLPLVEKHLPELSASGGVITIAPKPAVAQDEYTIAERRAIDRGIAESEKQYAAGKSYGPFDNAAEAIASIDANLRRRAAAKKRKPSGR